MARRIAGLKRSERLAVSQFGFQNPKNSKLRKMTNKLTKMAPRNHSNLFAGCICSV